MFIVLDPQHNSTPEMAYNAGAHMMVIKRGVPTLVSDIIGAGLLRTNPDLYRVATAAEIEAVTGPGPTAVPEAPPVTLDSEPMP